MGGAAASGPGAHDIDLPATPSADLSGVPQPRLEIDRVTAMRTLFSAPFRKVGDELYVETERGTCERDRNAIVLGAFSHVTTNTYFGRFPASFWQRWTRVAEVVVELVVTGAGRVTVMASDSVGESRIVEQAQVESTEDRRLTLTAPIDRFVDGGALWLELATDGAPMAVRDVRWTVLSPARQRPTSVVMCTFNRPDECLSTLDTLARDTEALLEVASLYVVDQGTDTVASREGEFGRIRHMFGAKLHYLRQPNLGGAGGFTRGLVEATADLQGEHVNVLFMDDDVYLEPDTVTRLTAFANATVEPTIVGAQMLQLLHPTRLQVSAERAKFTTLEPGLAVSGGLERADMTRKRQEFRVDADYNAWWCCLLPSEIVAEVGYPMPMFFQWDDVEFGYRCRQRGFGTVTLPGAAVWHAEFDWKDEDEWVRYFTLRNALIIDALRGDFRPAASAAVVLKWLAQCLVSMRYGQAAILIKAVEDFLRGPAVLDDGGLAVLEEIRAIRSHHPESVRHPASEIPHIPAAGRPMATAGPEPSRELLVLAKRLVWQFLGRCRGTVSIPCADARWWHVSRFHTAVVTDASQEAVRVRTYDKQRLLRLGAHALCAVLRLRRRGMHARQQWQQAAPQLTSRANWSRLFRIRPIPSSHS